MSTRKVFKPVLRRSPRSTNFGLESCARYAYSVYLTNSRFKFAATPQIKSLNMLQKLFKALLSPKLFIAKFSTSLKTENKY